MPSTRHEAVSALLAGRRTLPEVALQHGVTPDEVCEWVSLYQAGRRAQRRRLVLLAAGALTMIGAGVLSPGEAWAQAMCAQTLPMGFTTFCPDSPALASQVNGNFQATLNYVDARVGPAIAGQVTTPRVGASSGTLQIQTTTSGPTQFGGLVQLAGNTATNAATCDATTAGALRIANGTLEVCQRNQWSVVHAPPTSGATVSCKDILTATPGAPSGTYLLAAGGYAFQAECDMTTAGGGWTLAQGHLANARTVEGQRVVSATGQALPAAAFRALAQASTQIRFADATGSAITQANSAALGQLRNLLPVNSVNAETGLWTYSGALGAANFNSSCGTGDVYPVTAHTCGNSSGAHLYPATHSLRSSGGSDTLTLWLR